MINQTTLSMEELHEKFLNISSTELIVDVRTPEEFAEGHVPGSRNISYESVSDHAPELAKFERVYFYCRSGGRVSAACGALHQIGLTNFAGVVRGGMPDWIAAGYSVETT